MWHCSTWPDWELTKDFSQCLNQHRCLNNRTPHNTEEHIELSRFLASSRSMAFCFRLETRSLPSSSLPQKHFNIDRTGGLSWAGTCPASSTFSPASSTCSPRFNTCTHLGRKPSLNTIPVTRLLLLLSTGNLPTYSLIDRKFYKNLPLSPSFIFPKIKQK